MGQVRRIKAESILSREDRKSSQGFVNVKSQTPEQLGELIERQNKLLQNRSFLEKLPDKGEKILAFKAELEEELQKKQEEFDAACQLLYNLSLADKKTDEIEWTGRNMSASERQLDSDDDDEHEKDKDPVINPLKIVASHSGTADGKKIIKNSFESKITEASNSNTVKKMFYVDKYCEKYEKSNEGNPKERFKPNKLRNNDKMLFITSAEKIKKRLGNKWEVTQATPPAPIYKDAVMISLSESLKLQKEQAEKLQEIEKKVATEKLLQNMSVKMGDKLPLQNVTEYRSRNVNDFDGSAENFKENEFDDADFDDDDKTPDTS